MWLMGGKLNGGKVYGEWPGLSDAELYQKRDLSITTDFRRAISAVLTQHLPLPDAKLEQVFPYGAGARSDLPVWLRA